MIKFKSINCDNKTRNWEFKDKEELQKAFNDDFPDVPANDDEVFDVWIDGNEITALDVPGCIDMRFYDLYRYLVEPDIIKLLKDAGFNKISGRYVRNGSSFPNAETDRRIYIGSDSPMPGYAVRICPSECGNDLVKCTKIAIRMRPDVILFDQKSLDEYFIQKACDTVSRDDTAEYMAELLTDPDRGTYKMFEELTVRYLDGNKDVKKGINIACSALTGWNLDSIAKNILDRYG